MNEAELRAAADGIATSIFGPIAGDDLPYSAEVTRPDGSWSMTFGTTQQEADKALPKTAHPSGS